MNKDITGPANIPLTESERSKFQIGTSLLRSGTYAQAYRIFNDLSKKPNVSILFNLAICHFRSGEYQESAKSLERALQLIPMSPAEKVVDSTYDKLRVVDRSENDYMAPFDLELPTVLPQYARECIRRCLVDSYLELRSWDKVRSIAAMIGEEGFDNVNKALMIVDSQKGD